LAGVSYAELSFTSPSGKVKQGGSVRLNPAKSVSSSFAVTFPPHSESGMWTLTAVFLSDAAGNPLHLDPEAALRMGLRTSLEVKSASDTTPPNLTALRFSPDATDNLSGVKSIEVVFVSPSGQVMQRAAAAFPPAKELTGSVTAIFPQSSEPGNWKVGSVLVADAAGNTLNLDEEALSYKVGKSLQVR
jgi:Bacterial Ig-like domain